MVCVQTNRFDSSKGKKSWSKKNCFFSLVNIFDKRFKQPDENRVKIANHILEFISHEVEHGSRFI